VLGGEAGKGGVGLGAGVLALGMEGSAEIVEEHVFFWIWGDGWCWEVGGRLGRDGED